MRRVHIGVIGCVFLFAAAVSAQDTAPKADKFTSTSRVVMVDVVVADHHGNAITGLTAKDFQVLEDGKPQAITIVDVATLPTSDKPPLVLDADVYTNMPPPNINRGPAIILVLDVLNTRFADQHFIRKALLDFVKKHAPSGQPMAVFVLTTGLTLVQDFSTDQHTLLKAVAMVNGEQTLQPIETPTSAPALQDASLVRAVSALADLNGFAEQQFAMNRRLITNQAMKAIANYSRAIPGRKALVWFSDGFPVWIPSAGEAARLQVNALSQTLVNTFTEAQIAVYPADARGLVAYAPTNADLPTRFGGGGAGSYPQVNFAHWQTQREMTDLAVATGGRALINRNDLELAIDHAISDNRASYLLAYYPSNKSWDGRFRAIKVKLAGHAATLRYRRGYFATELPQTVSPDGFREAVLAGAPERGLVFHARVGAETAGARKVEFYVHGATLQNTAKDQQFDLDVQVITLAANRRAVQTGTRTVHTSLDAAGLDKARDSGVLCWMDVPVSPEIERLRLAVRDNVSGKFGVLEVPLTLAKTSAPNTP